jgi:hypothetical protein
VTAGRREPSTRLVDRVPDRVWLPAVLALVLAVGFVAALLVRADGDVSLLVHAGPPWTSETGAPGSLTMQPADEAFDGQFFYRIGVAPWSTEPVVAGITNDLPSLRNARWGYGALAWVASGGDRDLVPWALVGLNVVAAGVVGAVGGGLARSSGRHAGWGLLFVLWPGFAFSLSLDTSELVASAFALSGLLAIRHRRWELGALALSAAVLTRDTTAVIPAGVAAAGAWEWWSAARARRMPASPVPASAVPAGAVSASAVPAREGAAHPERRARSDGSRLLDAGLSPLVVFAGWQLVQRSRFGALPLTSSGDNNLAGPLTGLFELIGDSLPPDSGEAAYRLLFAAGLVGLLAAAAWCWRRSTAPLAERLAWLPAVAVVVLLNAYLWSGATAFGRAATEAGILSIAVLLGARTARSDRILAVAGLGLGGLWVLTAVAQFTKLG